MSTAELKTTALDSIGSSGIPSFESWLADPAAADDDARGFSAKLTKRDDGFEDEATPVAAAADDEGAEVVVVEVVVGDVVEADFVAAVAGFVVVVVVVVSASVSVLGCVVCGCPPCFFGLAASISIFGGEVSSVGNGVFCCCCCCCDETGDSRRPVDPAATCPRLGNRCGDRVNLPVGDAVVGDGSANGKPPSIVLPPLTPPPLPPPT